jgi:hypothetical protein
MRCLAFCCLVLSVFSSGCVPPGVLVTTKTTVATPYAVVRVEPHTYYLIDPVSESCVLSFYLESKKFEMDSILVDCAKLKKNLPEAAKFITWLPDTLLLPRCLSALCNGW